ncbi:COMM domain-containing protein 4-like [Pan paniscus]|uniref:COMM domain-containing protein 4-like n=1 Tax=Pan paniscus TaxID=9597 RepID=UPI0030049496
MGPSGSGDVKATVAVLSFMLSGAAKHSVDGESLASELQQLGLPKEHAASLCCCYEEKQSPLQKHLRICNLCTSCPQPHNAVLSPGSPRATLDPPEFLHHHLVKVLQRSEDEGQLGVRRG